MLSDQEAEMNETVTVDFRVNDFTSILSAQFTINWDAEILQFTEITNFNLPDLNLATNFGTTNADGGLVRFSWLDLSVTNGVSLEDGEQMFSIDFKVIGEPGTSTLVSVIDSMPVIIEFVDSSGTNIEPEIQNGTITVSNPLSTRFAEAGTLTMHQNAPNPFRQQTAIRIELNSAEELTLRIYDLLGNMIFENKKRYSAGEHSILINADQLPTAGSYIYELQNADILLTNKMVLIR
ncbi:MAG: cohesin domain-containing protein [Bacteroidota bacterium]